MLEQGGVVVSVTQPRALVAVALSQPIVMAGASGAGTTDTYGIIASQEGGQTAVANVLLDKVWMRTLRRSGQPAALFGKHFGLAPGFHHLVDPGTVKHNATIVLEDFFSATIAAGVCGVVFGFAEYLGTGGDPTQLTGVGFTCGPDHIWHTFVNDCPTNVAPVTVRRDKAIAGQLATSLHRLTVVIDGPTKTITWMIDRVVVDTWTPPAPLDQMSATGPRVLYAGSVPALGDVTIRYHGGATPQLRLLVR